ncbi:DNA polymerase [Anatilimnocola sp. NA78]|uniref:DNA polymerase n=1 Tax=Anatilimnocola sp. NA78 TaxID=3415683 RepID=UPI003CE47D7F
MFLLACATDGENTVTVRSDHLTPFVRQHAQCDWVMFDSVSLLEQLDKVVRRAGDDVYALVDRNRVWDLSLLWRLRMLCKVGKSDAEHSLPELLRVLSAAPRSAVRSLGDLIAWLKEESTKILATYKIVQRDIACRLRQADEAFRFQGRRWIKDQIAHWGPQTHHIQIRGAIALQQISAAGLPIDVAQVQKNLAALRSEQATLLGQLADEGYVPRESGSEQLLRDLLQHAYAHHPDLAQPDSGGDISLREDDLKSLGLREPFVDAYLQESKVSRLIQVMGKMDKPTVHTTFDPLLVTGRSSASGDIPAQSLPRDPRVRSCISAPPGKLFVIADYVAIELAALAQVTLAGGSQSSLAELFNRGVDIHRFVAGRLLGKPTEAVNDAERQKVKPINFGVPGGMSTATLCKYAAKTYDVTLTENQATEWRQRWLELFPEVREYRFDSQNANAVFTCTGRLRSEVDYCASRNTPFQGLAADGAKFALWNLLRQGYLVRNFVHDEFLVEVDADSDVELQRKKICKILREAMRLVIPDVRIEVKSRIAKSWSP